jgi:hypothetical protein
MRRFLPHIAVVTLAASAVSILSAQPPSVPSEATVQKWEYMVVNRVGTVGGATSEKMPAFQVASQIENNIKQAGAEGWEYAGPYVDGTFLFKRPKP